MRPRMGKGEEARFADLTYSKTKDGSTRPLALWERAGVRDARDSYLTSIFLLFLFALLRVQCKLKP
jgi:hypothetical protein